MPLSIHSPICRSEYAFISSQKGKGSAILESGIIISFLIPLLFGTIASSQSGNMLQSAQITRDVAHMYRRDVDFSSPPTRTSPSAWCRIGRMT